MVIGRKSRATSIFTSVADSPVPRATHLPVPLGPMANSTAPSDCRSARNQVPVPSNESGSEY